MTYELAKELKDAGFNPEYPQSRENSYSYVDVNNNPCGVLGNGAVYIPTLEELIEACGDKFRALWHDVSNEPSRRWRTTPDTLVNKSTPAYYSTPEEAVARLWLDINVDARIVVIPSGRIDYCVECNGQHGYVCPKLGY